MTEAPVNVKLQITVEADGLYANLELTNRSDSDLLIDKYKFLINGKMTTQAFTITDEESNKMDYIGKLIKRVPRKEDFIPMAPRTKIETKIKLNDYYRFDDSARKYKIQFIAFDPFENLEDMYEIASNIEEVTYPK